MSGDDDPNPISWPVGRLLGKQIRIAIDYSADETARANGTDYACWLFYWVPHEDEPDASHQHIVRIDDRRHGGPHIDRHFSDEGGMEPLPDTFSADDAVDKLEQNWRHYARSYHDLHGGWPDVLLDS